VRDFSCYDYGWKGGYLMSVLMVDYLRQIEEGEKLRRQEFETRIPVAHCQVGNHPIYANHDYVMKNEKPICLTHREEQLPEIENVGHGSPHGGCVSGD